ncbi:hypothetical protein KHC28_00100 [Ancylobacter sonchi]|uniref:hypothetical protein n=1 Tax=Ancylobacter sonchi TaxID=1937790 RepID=UPI001BD54153|nr:hypothetical protein [Ancylobacter sonchi]MBS7532066.1 hypothetical protein [Ancylobacter sonchi]
MAHRISSGIPPRQKNDRPKKARRVAPERGRLEDPLHLALLRQLPCLVSGRTPAGEAAHIRFASAMFHKPVTGISIKPDDKWAVPLSAWFHTVSRDAQHRHGEEGWWEDRGINPLVVASNLFAASVALRDARVAEAEIVERLTAIVEEARRAAC